jgi:uridine kinase
MSRPHSVHLIAVVGGSGAGKGWFVERICRLLGEMACHLQLDDFYRDLSHLPLAQRAQQNFDVPDAIDWTQAERVLRDCRSGEPTVIPTYDFATHCRASPARWEPRRFVLVDGLWLLHRAEIRALFALSIYLDTPPELRHSRRLARDVAERGYTREAVERQLRTAVAPMHERYIEPQKAWADIVLAQPFSEGQLLDLSNRLWSLLTSAGANACWEHAAFRAELLGLLAHHEYCN